jgi:hypothetical protein
MAYKDSTGEVEDELELDNKAMFFSRPLVLGGRGFGVLNFFFDPTDISPEEIEKISTMVADFVDDYWETKERVGRVTN